MACVPRAFVLALVDRAPAHICGEYTAYYNGAALSRVVRSVRAGWIHTVWRRESRRAWNRAVRFERRRENAYMLR